MPENSSSSPVIANRYRFQAVSDDWDTGRSGFTHLVFDMKKKRLGVLKRADLKSKEQVENLKNEAAALLTLKGSGVPKVYDEGDAEYGSKNYFYLVMEYIEGVRVEKNLASLSIDERAEIIRQLFRFMALAHQKGIVNGDIDLKHLFWRRDKQQLVIIDWGNARLNVNPKDRTEFAYDLARSAEIIYSLVTKEGNVPATGSIALPAESELISKLMPLPSEFYNLCRWAPRTPNLGAEAPYTAKDLFEASKRWPYASKLRGVLIAVVCIVLVITLIRFTPLYSQFQNFANSLMSAPTPTAVSLHTPTAMNTAQSSEEATAIVLPTSTLTPTASPTNTLTLTPAITPSPRNYDDTSSAVVFKAGSSSNICWAQDTNLPNGTDDLKPNEGFYQRSDDSKNWGFKVFEGRTTDQFIETNFSECLISINPIGAMGVNAWVTRMDLQRDVPDSPGTIEPGNEFGFFIENEKRERREYTIWIDKNELMHLRIREGNTITHDEVKVVANNLKILGEYPRYYAEFSIQMFLEIDNQGMDIIYLRGGPLTQAPGTKEELIPIVETRIDSAARPTLGNAQKIGLIGYGGETGVLIWPLAFFGE